MRVGNYSSGKRLPAHQMSEVGAESTVSNRSGDRMAIDAGSRFKDAASLDNGVAQMRRLALPGDPLGEIIRGLHNRNAQQHLGVLCAAILSALSQEKSLFVRVDPHTIRVIRNQIGFTSEPWNPKTVIGIGGQQFDEGWSGMLRVAQRNVQFIHAVTTFRPG